MKKIVLLVGFICSLSFSVVGQENSSTESKIWYLWIDTMTEIDGKSTRILSKEPFKITCCLKSPKYRKLGKKAEKWIKKNVTKDYQGSPFNKIQDEALARTMIKEASAKSGDDLAIKMINYQDQCEE